MKRMQLAPGKGLILMVNRTALRPKNAQARPQAIVRGILQIVTDINADGVGLNDQGLKEADVAQVKSDADKQAVMKRMQLAPGKGLILMVNRTALRPKNAQARPQAIVRGILQIVTDINADGVGLNDQGLKEADVAQVKSDADVSA
ncbi:hypothetical protein HPB50_007315 [Hyalomma asiaticum]|uniref:Uncharacterized protein n=1 Tax=Hyalomma asiaticum TaxID=266040 RepID=A0ACB7SYD2_HYAAI|nr:hypothetical protein HPB50_007315 [Hyalomma asiaticum]